MAAGLETESAASVDNNNNNNNVVVVVTNESENINAANVDDNGPLVESKKGSESDSNSEMEMQGIVGILSNLKLNPMAKEFFPSSYSPVTRNVDKLNYFAPAFYLNSPMDAIEGHPPNRRRRNNYSQGRRWLNGRAYRAQREDSIKRTVYVSDIDHNVTEERLAALFSAYGHVLDCRVCGDPHSRLRFAFVEFADENSARAALNLCGIMLGFSQVRVLPSKTAILPVNPTFLPRSEDEKEMCARTVYCTNIDKKVSQAEVKNFFEARCGEVSRIRLLGDHVHSTRIAFVEFVMAESAIVALDCCGQTLGTQPIRVSPSKTPVRPRVARSLPTN
ncbi:putative RNA recognition motif domain, ataxin-2, RNA-binding domain superfamily [Helianthus annuus]|uniref:Putative CTC-interacting domain 9 n=1 Tax=Helianthus annuus TaxID=4232 RepID=A0A251T9V4_HELAN|nr:polyadenylate-binding protein-interacting protein 9 [Helianthus annuus]KAF5780668.1 putative RNA recognition motif domain, ataxin-2, RNA-binding domain superfamily [Helianthus annuus]KAJ0516283.1 putative RNA recognition motif domain, ataxin-2, RNA-binding domain superfamily [Helianthus annuus]KAJ0873879.1 putative RNA recognition motif domain, ataxin-2, RNA-binding domain superfamily [Helianthus annuus]